MLDVGVALALPGTRVVGYVEWQAYAASQLLARMAESTLEPAPVWCGDVRDFDATAFRGAVDLVIAGFPCQPVAKGGKNLGVADPRWLWPQVARILYETDAELVFLENVPAIRTAGLHPVLSDLARLGFDAEWGCIQASAVGAPHRRNRWFCLGYTERARLEECARRIEVAEAELETAERDRNPVFPPAADALPAWRRLLGDAPEIEPAVCLQADGVAELVANRTDRLQATGNGVVPLQAAAAFRILLERGLNDG
jgi:DNA (cytosine-5)-methyltransferase 1